VRLVDEILVVAWPKTPPRFVLTGLDGDGALARDAAARYPDTRVVWFHFEVFAADLARSKGLDPGLMLVQPDIDLASVGDERPDLIALPFPRGGEGLLVRELIEEAHDALVIGGRFLAATDGDPAWLRKVARDVFRNAEVSASPIGAVVRAERRRADPSLKDHSHVAKLSFGGRDLAFRTRPGVFSYGHVDHGSKALLSVADFTGSRRFLDIGCGVGVLGIAAASVAPQSSVVLVDSNVRAVALAGENASRNGITSAEAISSADPLSLALAPFDCVLANPPYFNSFKIAERFIDAAFRHLAPHGRLWLVAKAAEEHVSRVRARFGNADVRMSGDYGVISAVKQ